MRINDPEIVAELAALYPLYETALVTKDADTLTGMFWASPHASIGHPRVTSHCKLFRCGM